MFKRVLLLLLVLLSAWLAYELLTFPNVSTLATEAPKTTAFMERRKRELRRAGKDDTLSYQWVSYGRISPNLRRAVLVSEDNEFYQHEGVDVEAMREALKRDWKRRKITHGGSTITQQLAKNLYLSPSRNPLRKVKEYLIARSLEKHLSKKRILEIYLNVVEFGERIYGAEAAARAYFNTSASSLSPSQAALLAGCLPNPRVMVPGSPNKRLRARQRIILSRLRRWGYEAEREVLTAPKPAAAPAPKEQAPAETTTTATDPDLVQPETTETSTTDAVEPPQTATEPVIDTTPTTTDTTATSP